MNWEETIKYIRTQHEFDDLVEKAYLDERLELNVDRYIKGEEWQETLAIVRKYFPLAKSILDVGSGNGISAIAFALSGYNVTVIEPDPSDTVGAGAIRILKKGYGLTNITILETFAENAVFGNSQFDVVYCRQSMHHAQNLESFVFNITSSLKSGGLFFTVRDHVIFDLEDKEKFLQSHPLQKFYGGENAFKPNEYREAIKSANLLLIRELKYYESIINYFPLTAKDLEQMKETRSRLIRNASQKIPFGSASILFPLFRILYNFMKGEVFNEKKVPGRMYSYIAMKAK